MKCLSPLTVVKKQDSTGQTSFTMKRTGTAQAEDGYLISCGQCIACRINRSRMWALRCTHEAQLHTQSCFITLTYNPEHLPSDLSVSSRELQLFVKRLRKAISPHKIRFYAAAEYGSPTDLEVNNGLSKVGRPHYHLLIFGWYPPDCIPLKQGRRGHTYYTSEIVLKAWQGKGFVVIGSVTPQSAGYVAGYCTKKVAGANADEHYRRIHPTTGETLIVSPEFQRCSQGIGKQWLEKYSNDLAKGFLTHDGKKYPIPRYYMKKINEHFDKTGDLQMLDLLNRIDLSRGDRDNFNVLPDFEELNYKYDVAKVYRERAAQRASITTL